MTGKNATAIRHVPFTPVVGRTERVEVTDVAGIRERGGPAEFLDPQRLGFELVVLVTHGATHHEVDFARVDLTPGDILWVRAGQIQRWGDIDAIEGIVLLFPPEVIAPATSDHFRRIGAESITLWSAAAREGSPTAIAFASLVASAARVQSAESIEPAAVELILTHLVSAALMTLAASELPAGRSVSRSHAMFDALRDAITASFATERSVGWYAAHLGYSERTLNRLARAHAGASAKELIDRQVVLEAKRQLVHENVSVATIATRLAFDDAANFSKYFSHRVGMTPGEFRRES
ncbi:helix-turn-helix domain-containing protein [Agromyces atrinae]|uniref:AraC family transcriptional regulator n=1 Tax=Agromyces atrinae TaxID=592376 RepID=UPI001F5ABC8C|nr:helix-turn-helix domain-containing protein [Agromyces atrinae]MCI2957533.1 helix-turn-helix domain-containing protein [Agromyces atrinae]